MAFPVVIGLVKMAIVTHDTLDQIEGLVQPTVSGKKTLCPLITEPNAGANSFARISLATGGANGYVLRGEKLFVSEGNGADSIRVVAQATLKARMQSAEARECCCSW